MKKFLFTLAALFMMSTAYAGDAMIFPAEYQNMTLTQEQLGTEIQVRMTAQFEHYINTYRLMFTLPDGITITKALAGNGSKLAYYNADGDDETLKPDVTLTGNNMLAMIMTQCYTEDGVLLGILHWAPGTYTDFVRVSFTVAADYAGGEISYVFEPAASGWGDHSQDCPQNSHYEYTYTWNVPSAPQLTDLTADIVIGDAEGLFVPITVTNVNDPEAEIVVTVGETTYTIENGGITLPEWDTDYTVVVTVTAKGEEYTGTVTESKPVHTGVQPVTACEIVWTAADGQVSVNVESEEGAEVHLYMGREEVAIPYTTTYDIYEGYGPVHFTATAQVTGKAQGSDEADVYATKVDKQDFTGNITIGDPDEDGVVAVGYDGTETGYTMTVTVDGEPATVTDGTITVTEGTHNIVVTISAEGYNDLSNNKEVTYTAPVIYDETCLAPNSAYAITGTETATVTITNREEGATVYYDVYCDGVLVDQGNFTGDQFSFDVTGDGDYVVHAVAKMQGKNDSPDGGVFFTISEGEEPPVTGIDELVNGKQVAGVRYFNMAGQEMQEINGMTIVVTTYTDGTTSAVKVMK